MGLGQSASRKAESGATPTESQSVEIADAVLENNTIIESVRDGLDRLSLLVWDGTRARIVPRLEHRGRVYLPVQLRPGEARKIQLPTHAAEFGSTRKLFNSMLAFVRQYSSIDNQQAKLVTHFALASWFPGCSSEVPMLVITGAEFESLQLLRVLHCLCRRALLLRGRSHATGAYGFPELHPTLLIDASDQSTAGLHAIMVPGSEDFYVLRNGVLSQDCCGKAIYAGDLSGAAIPKRGLHVSVLPSMGQPILDANTRRRVANKFQPQLLHYRLRNLAAARDSNFDLPGFTSAVREAGRGLGACIIDDPDLQGELVGLLRAEDEIASEEMACSVNAAVVEALLTVCHEDKSSVSVKDVASLTNTILQDRGENLTLNPRGPGIGHRLTFLGIPPRSRTGPGKKILLTQDLRRQVHQLARAYRSKMIWNSRDKCSLCAEMASSAVKE